MKVIDTYIEGLKIIEPRVFYDGRGYFFETYNNNKLPEKINKTWVQDNESKSKKGVLRGLHWQSGEYAQAKLVRVIKGSVFDVAVDLRIDSPTFGQWHGEILSGRNKKQMFIPRNFAHGFLVLSSETIFSYKCDNYYNKDHEMGMIYSDSEIGIIWPKLNTEYIISNKDRKHPTFDDLKKSW